jgi:hypothetical protein
VKRILKRALTILFVPMIALTGIVMVFSTADHLGVGGPEAAWHGLDFIPAVWLFVSWDTVVLHPCGEAFLSCMFSPSATSPLHRSLPSGTNHTPPERDSPFQH